MKRALFFIFLAIALTASSSQADSIDSVLSKSETELVRSDYALRRDLMKNFAGKNGSGYQASVGFDRKDLGLWGATDILTEWQFKTGRNQDPHWSLPNAEINVVPSVFLREYLDHPQQPCSESAFVRLNSNSVNDPNDHKSLVGLCEGWKAFYKIQTLTGNKDKSEIQIAYWSAHMKALNRAFRRFRKEIESYKIPKEEQDYWQGYVRLINIYADINGTTNDILNGPFFKYALPQCYPLGSTSCSIKNLPWASRQYVKFVMSLGNGTCSEKIFGMDCESLAVALLSPLDFNPLRTFKALLNGNDYVIEEDDDQGIALVRRGPGAEDHLAVEYDHRKKTILFDKDQDAIDFYENRRTSAATADKRSSQDMNSN